jgi:hypothetical protein
MDFMYGIIYAYFSSFTLFWIFPYAVMTLRNKSVYLELPGLAL